MASVAGSTAGDQSLLSVALPDVQMYVIMIEIVAMRFLITCRGEGKEAACGDKRI